MTEITQLADGIYFNLPEKTYFAQDRLSTSKITKLLAGPLVYYRDVIEPTLPGYVSNEEDTETKAQFEGKAWHCMALEGRKVFESRYTVEFDAESAPAALKSKEHHIKACAAHGVSHNKSITIPALKALLVDAGAPVKFIDDLKAAHLAANEGKELLTVKQMDELTRAGLVQEQYGLPEVYFSGGYSEVSILFTINGIKFQVRCDYLQPDRQIEFKTVANKYSRQFDEAIVGHMSDYNLFIGANLYQLAVEFARSSLHDDLSFAHGLPKDQAATDWIDSFITGSGKTRHGYHFVFQQRGKYNHALAREFPKYDHVANGRKVTSMWNTGKIRIERAVSLYQHYMETNGLERPWLPPLNPKAFDDADFKPWQLEQ